MKVSICIPTFNQSAFVRKAVLSAFKQSHSPFEIIVVDDCSTDDTELVLSQLTKEIPQLKYMRQQANLGIAGNVDCCLRMATGDYIIRLDSDDMLLPDYTLKLLELYSQYPDAGYAHAAVQEIDQSDNLLLKRKLFRKSIYEDGIDALRSSVKGYKVAANIIMFKKEALVRVNYLTGRPDFGEDFHLSVSISAAGFGNIYSDEILSFYRLWVDLKNVRSKRKLVEILGLRSVFEQVIEPAFKFNNWSTLTIKKSRTSFACSHASCLSWDIYSLTEKKEIEKELLKFSSVAKVKFYIWVYSSGYGKVLSGFQKLKSNLKFTCKALFLRIYLKQVN